MGDIEVGIHPKALHPAGCAKQNFLVQPEVIHKQHPFCYSLNLRLDSLNKPIIILLLLHRFDTSLFAWNIELAPQVVTTHAFVHCCSARRTPGKMNRYVTECIATRLEEWLHDTTWFVAGPKSSVTTITEQFSNHSTNALAFVHCREWNSFLKV
ncbi:unnamed protein product [Gongylonema pulchrum]|uniref:Uncharacterized protein n=1 Tax=Gongylonema pulchrum TaxID=637853 RepID=A0A183CUF9_9BILA|nr:unnamed protein product [Gongylonema pulchrum]